MRKAPCLVCVLFLLFLSLAGCGKSQEGSILTGPPETFLCAAADLPVDGAYLIPGAGNLFQTANDSLLASGGEEARAYVENTGRLDGWIAQYQRGANDTSLPEQIFCGSVRYASVEGARLSVNDYNSSARGLPGWEIVPGAAVGIGDESVVLKYRSSDAGEQRIWLVIEFSYHNYVIDVGGLGPESSVGLGLLKGVGQRVLEHLKAGALATPTPIP